MILEFISVAQTIPLGYRQTRVFQYLPDSTSICRHLELNTFKLISTFPTVIPELFSLYYSPFWSIQLYSFFYLLRPETLQSSLVPFFVPHPTFNLSVNFVSSAFKTYPKSDHSGPSHHHLQPGLFKEAPTGLPAFVLTPYTLFCM